MSLPLVSTVTAFFLVFSFNAYGAEKKSLKSEGIELGVSLDSEKVIYRKSYIEDEHYTLANMTTSEDKTFENIELTTGHKNPSKFRSRESVEVNPIKSSIPEFFGNVTISAPQVSASEKSDSLNWRGTYASGTRYQLNDLVAYQGRSYVNTKATDGSQVPNDTDHWHLFSDKGSDGAQGVAGATGATGVQGPTGASGERGIPGVQGEQGPIGITGSPGTDGAQGVAGPIGPAGLRGTVGTDGLDGLDGFDGLDGEDAPEIAVELCELYQSLAKSSQIHGLTLIRELSAPSYCSDYISDYNPRLYSVGDVGPAGGIVFHVTDDGEHGIETAPRMTDAKIWCGYGTFPVNLGHDTAFGTGLQNTLLMLDYDCAAAGSAATYNGPDGKSTGWYLPSRDELTRLVSVTKSIGSPVWGSQANFFIWSSSNIGIETGGGYQFGNAKAWTHQSQNFPRWIEYDWGNALYIVPVRNF